MSAAGDPVAREARVLARVLGHDGPIDFLLERYRRLDAREGRPRRRDRRLQLAFLRAGSLGARIASAWAARWDRHGPLRRREVIMLALLECRPETMARVERCADGGPLAAWPRLVLWGCAEVVCLLLALPFFAPARFFGGRS
ncbi:MAG: hypothetical protein H6807_10620 [Planctomycetes bacterium]|nr:hypothetical protein [Planctomycetota bacterium]